MSFCISLHSVHTLYTKIQIVSNNYLFIITTTIYSRLITISGYNLNILLAITTQNRGIYYFFSRLRFSYYKVTM